MHFQEGSRKKPILSSRGKGLHNGACVKQTSYHWECSERIWSCLPKKGTPDDKYCFSLQAAQCYRYPRDCSWEYMVCKNNSGNTVSSNLCLWMARPNCYKCSPIPTPDVAHFYPWDDEWLERNTQSIHSESNTNRKCEYRCDPGYIADESGFCEPEKTYRRECERRPATCLSAVIWTPDSNCLMKKTEKDCKYSHLTNFRTYCNWIQNNKKICIDWEGNQVDPHLCPYGWENNLEWCESNQIYRWDCNKKDSECVSKVEWDPNNCKEARTKKTCEFTIYSGKPVSPRPCQWIKWYAQAICKDKNGNAVAESKCDPEIKNFCEFRDEASPESWCLELESCGKCYKWNGDHCFAPWACQCIDRGQWGRCEKPGSLDDESCSWKKSFDSCTKTKWCRWRYNPKS